jgi:hypothetical protein
MYRLDFTKDQEGVLEISPEDNYSVCIQAVLTNEVPTPFEQWDDAIGLLKKLKGLAAAPAVVPSEYKLKSEGGIIELERGERQILVNCVRSCKWVANYLERARACYKWLTSMQESPAVPVKAGKR